MQRAEAERVLLPERFGGATIHPPKEQLVRFLRGELARAERLPVVRHMLTGCTVCLKVTRPVWELMERGEDRR
jgi:hypothetical protein